ncbi:hypothetical protein EPD60_05075 [Flaviaesturariibacter flavus]|uniref:Outer membrane protein beta-barrel domain-containing protein n=1 Tax=Flaviaesturariibacter flavus TaxID=2502780 RepID=A0A4R1BJY1_9BACT|nr:hypothetical protein [Flaviaesturariibacter flavus]TCJ17567.1 hypothetical protein EPD60_05075 [Flaviaesturariibacter flavus]
MSKTNSIWLNKRKQILTALCVVFSVGAFATLGDGKGNPALGVSANRSFSIRSHYSATQRFSLRSGLTYSADRLLTEDEPRVRINLNATITYQRGNTTYIVPLKKKPVLLDKVKFNPY